MLLSLSRPLPRLFPTLSPSLRTLSSSSRPTILFCGAGNMAAAMIKPLLTSSSFPTPPEVLFTDVSPSTRAGIKKLHPTAIDCTDNLVERTRGKKVDVVVIAVKPQNCDDLYRTLHPALSQMSSPPVILSICAGVPVASFERGLGTTKIIRSMPNTPAMIERGVTVWAEGKNGGISGEEVEMVRGMLVSFGTEIKVEDEK